MAFWSMYKNKDKLTAFYGSTKCFHIGILKGSRKLKLYWFLDLSNYDVWYLVPSDKAKSIIFSKPLLICQFISQMKLILRLHQPVSYLDACSYSFYINLSLLLKICLGSGSQSFPIFSGSDSPTKMIFFCITIIFPNFLALSTHFSLGEWGKMY